MYLVGTAKADITGFKKGVGMMGYGMYFNTVEGIATPLLARAYVIKEKVSGRKIIFVNAEIAFITVSIKRAVVKKLQRSHPEGDYHLSNVMLTAQHTHSGPGGYSHYGFYNLSIPGFVPEVFQAIVNGIVQAILKAEKELKPANMFFHKGTFEPGLEVAFNRSLEAYNANPEVKKYSIDEKHLAVDREMLMLRIDGENDEKIGMLNWFGVHTTSISNNNHLICSDNKGYAASFFEEYIKKQYNAENFLSAFAQGAAGDVSPNFIWDKKLKWTRGKYEDDYESARYNGRLQFEKAREIYEDALGKNPIHGELDYALMYVDFSNVVAAPEFTGGIPDAQTGSGCLGVSFFEGTKEGPGMSRVLGGLSKVICTGIKGYEHIKGLFLNEEERKKLLLKYRVHGKKYILVETGERKILGTGDVKNLLIPSWADKGIAAFKEHHRNGSLDVKPWTPQTLPLQIVIIGEIAIAGIPGEITTVAGWRLRDTIYNVLKFRGVRHVLITSYVNAYSGYITTYEEYQHQCYEGGHTVFGEWTLAAFQTKFKQLAEELLKPHEERQFDTSIEPVQFTEEELRKRSFSSALK